MTIASLISTDLKNFLQEIEELGFSLCLVGGAPRDFLLEKRLSLDLDFEIRKVEIDVLIAFLKKKSTPYSVLPYQIIRVKFHDYDLEFSMPRMETSILGNKTHHHFEATLDKDFSYEESFKRRDFTLNAIGIELQIKNKNEVIVDPYNGVADLNQKTLRAITDDFFLDSVRFLRLIRFSIKYNFSISSEIENKLGRFDLSGLSKHHFIEEMTKSKSPGPFINRFNELVKKYQLKTSAEFKFWSELLFSDKVETREDLLVEAFLQKKDKAMALSTFFSMPEKTLKDLKSFSTSFFAIRDMPKSELIEMAKKPLIEIRNLAPLKDMKNLEDKKDWRKYFSGLLPVSWENWQTIVTPTAELEQTQPHVRSYLKYYKALQRLESE
jgi:hypothetical protein